MNKFPFTGFLALCMVVAASHAADCGTLKGCAKKICELQNKIDATTEPHALERLKKALGEAKANCTDGDLKAKARAKADERAQKAERKIEKAKADADKAKAKMEKALSEGKSDKAAKYRRKMEEKLQKAKRLESAH